MGQSAGGASILHHMVAGAGAKEFKPNFTRAILQSPAFLPESDYSSTDSNYVEFQNRIGVRRGNVKDMQKKSTFDIQIANAVMTWYSKYGLFNFGPKVDYDFIPRLPGQLILNNTYHKGIPMILGHTTLDGLLFVPPWIRSDAGLEDYMIELFPYMEEKAFETIHKPLYYPIPEKALEIQKINAVTDLLDDLAIACNNHYLTNSVLKNDSSTSVWRYIFGARPAVHGSDVFFTVRTSFCA